MLGRFLVFVLLVVTGACSNDGGRGTAVLSGASSSAELVSPIDDLATARLTLDGEPDWLAVDRHGIWVQRASGELTLVDPQTNEVAGVVNLGDLNLCSGIGAAFGSIWTCLGSDVVQVDPKSLEVMSRYAVHKQAAQGHLVGGFSRVWVLTSDGSSLVGIDPYAHVVADEFSLPARCTDVSLADDALWLPCPVDGRVLKVDPMSGEVLLNLEIPQAVAIAVDTDVWVGTAPTTMQLDPSTGEVLQEVEVGAAPDGGVALDADSVWVRNGTDFLIQVDRETGSRIQHVTADVTSGGDLLVARGELWTTAFDDQQLFRLDPDGGW